MHGLADKLEEGCREDVRRLLRPEGLLRVQLSRRHNTEDWPASSTRFGAALDQDVQEHLNGSEWHDYGDQDEGENFAVCRLTPGWKHWIRH